MILLQESHTPSALTVTHGPSALTDAKLDGMRVAGCDDPGTREAKSTGRRSSHSVQTLFPAA